MVTVVLRRASRVQADTETADEGLPAPTPRKRGWTNLRGECVAEMRALGVSPVSADVGSVRGEWRER